MLRSLKSVQTWLAALALAGLVTVAGCPKPQPQPEPAEPPAEEPAAEEPVPAEPAAEEASAETAEQSELLVTLPPETCNTPDGMTLLADGNVILSMPNFNDLEQGSRLMRITPANQAEVFLELPNHPETGKPLGPLGICSLPSGDLVFADFQMEGDRQSRVMRIVMAEGQPKEIVPAITGFHVSNAVIVRDGNLYVSETQIDTEVTPAISGIFRFPLEELEQGVVELADNELEDPHLIAKIECHDEDLPLGADGLTFDDEGNLYCGNFADGTVHRIRFDAEGNVTANEIFAQSDAMKSSDGLFWDPVEKVIYVADSRANAIQTVALDGTVTTLAQNGDTDGSDGGMDQPCEVLLRGRELIVSNMDWPVAGCVNQQYNETCTLSVVKLQ